MVLSLSRGLCPIVTSGTRRSDAAVVELLHVPATGRMTAVTLSIRFDMACGLSGRSRAIVAIRAGSGRDICMTETRIGPAKRVVAGIALGCGLDMRLMLALGFHAIMAGLTRTHYRRVIHSQDPPPAEGGVAHATLIVRLNMRGSLDGGD